MKLVKPWFGASEVYIFKKYEMPKLVFGCCSQQKASLPFARPGWMVTSSADATAERMNKRIRV